MGDNELSGAFTALHHDLGDIRADVAGLRDRVSKAEARQEGTTELLADLKASVAVLDTKMDALGTMRSENAGIARVAKGLATAALTLFSGALGYLAGGGRH